MLSVTWYILRHLASVCPTYVPSSAMVRPGPIGLPRLNFGNNRKWNLLQSICPYCNQPTVPKQWKQRSERTNKHSNCKSKIRTNTAHRDTLRLQREATEQWTYANRCHASCLVLNLLAQQWCKCERRRCGVGQQVNAVDEQFIATYCFYVQSVADKLTTSFYDFTHTPTTVI